MPREVAAQHALHKVLGGHEQLLLLQAFEDAVHAPAEALLRDAVEQVLVAEVHESLVCPVLRGHLEDVQHLLDLRVEVAMR